MNEQRVKKVAQNKRKLIRPLYTTLITALVLLNIYVVFDTTAKNRQVKHVNEQIEKQIKKGEEIQVMSDEAYKQSQENNERLDQIITRLNLHLDQLDRQ